MQSEHISSKPAPKFKGDNMDFMKKFLVLLAIFCIIGSAAAVSAEDIGSDNGGYAGSNYEDMNQASEIQYNPDDHGISKQENLTTQQLTIKPLQTQQHRTALPCQKIRT